MTTPGERKPLGQLFYETIAGALAKITDMPYHGWDQVPPEEQAIYTQAARSFVQESGGEGPVNHLHACGHRLLSLGCQAAHQMAGEPVPGVPEGYGQPG